MPDPSELPASQHASFNSGAHVNSSNVPYLRRGSSRAGMPSELSSNMQKVRRNSVLSDSVSEARYSLRSSTDDLLFPRASKDPIADIREGESHWHSAPLALALLPAIGGILFKNGSAVITDVTLLVLAAIFLNWSVRLPWDWYKSAQAIRQRTTADFGVQELTEEPGSIDEADEPSSSKPEDKVDSTPKSNERLQQSAAVGAANKELRIHELAALASCFVFPVIGTWLLHAIRSKLSRPSEGLVSNYNLTIFLLASEIRPFSHLLKMVQGRTLFLQRVVASSPFEEDRIDTNKVVDIAKRLDELEAYVANKAAERIPDSGKAPETSSAPDMSQQVVMQATSEVRRGLQPELDALNRAMRRYEKRTTLTNLQIESELQKLETRVQDAIALAAAAQRSTAGGHQNYALILLDWVCAIVVLPVQATWALASMPSRIATWGLFHVKSVLGLNQRRVKTGKPRYPQGQRGMPSSRLQQKTVPLTQLPGGRGPKKAM
ncbi:hypothetical protein Plec18167_004279 [Paecilomyces lecythidis]|uniref:Uncharacterized protein n=1 Tax=Paecilomyces lecythidis TaxID=3004212 RepID=A0ABR3XTD1_9EURO